MYSDPMHITQGLINLVIILSVLWFIISKYKKLKSTIKRIQNNTDKILELLESEEEN